MRNLLLTLLLSLCSCRSPAITNGIPNFAQVKPGIWRGGEPNMAGWLYLKSLGVQRIVKLNKVDINNIPPLECDFELCHFPISWKDQTVGKPSSNDVHDAVMAITTNVYVQCLHGQDRTGLIIGAYRVKVDHWSKHDAYKEMKRHHFHPGLRGLYWSWEDDVN